MATLKQKTAFNKMLENVRNQNPKPMGQILVESGYKKIANQPSRIIDSNGFQELLATINDKAILDRFYEILVDEDKRASIQAGVELLKLKDRYPAQKTKIQGLFANIDIDEKNEEK